MKLSSDMAEQLRNEIGSIFRFSVDEDANKGVLVLPFKDALGDNFVVRLREKDSHFILDDGGIIQNTLFVMSETVGAIKARRLVSTLVTSFGARLDTGEGLLELVSTYDEVVSRLLHFTKMLVTIDTMLVEIGRDEKESGRPHRQSLGPRAAQRIRKSLKPLIDVRKVSHRVTMDGLTIPDWIVDFVYKPTVEQPPMAGGLVILISVDLAVLDPILKATYAYSRAMDIKAAHANYAIRVAYDAHGQDSASTAGARFLEEHQIRDKAYSAIDLSKSENFLELVRTINRETGMIVVG